MNSRQKELEQLFLNEEKQTLEQLKKNYQAALDDINERIAILKGREDASLQNVVYQINYQQALRGQIQTILEQLQNSNYETVAEYLAKAYEDGFIGTLYDLQGQGIPLIMPIDQKQVVAAIQHETKLSESLYAALGKDTKELSKQIASEITRGISTASGYADIARSIASTARISQNNAMRIARTEAHRIQNKAISDAQWGAKEKGADIVKIWSAALDGRTRDTHRRLDGQIRELDEPFEIDGMTAMEPGDFGDPSEDCNCRCRCNSKARWLLDAETTKHLGKTDDMSDEELEPIAKKLGIEVDELRKYSDQIIPVQAKDYEDFRRQYEKLVNHDAVGRVRLGEQKTKPLEKSGKGDTIKLKDTQIFRSVGAKARNYDIVDPSTGDNFHFVEGTKIQDSEVFAGKGTNHPLHEGVAEGLSEQFGGKPDNWQHCKGIGVIDYNGESIKAEVHWFQEDSVGKVKFKVKEWLDES